MKNNTLLFISTHLINKAVISEYTKLSKVSGCDCLLVIDNTKLQLPINNDCRVQKLTFYEKEIDCFLFDEDLNNSLKLPMLAAQANRATFGDVMWSNADYRFIYVKKYFPNYDYYWQFDYDIFCNGKSYETFINKYQHKKDDLLICGFSKINKDTDWCWAKDIDWIYKDTQLYGSFFPICRLSKNAIDFLYQKRIEYGKLYKNLNNNKQKWPLCELFVPVELANNNFSCSAINEDFIYSHNYNLNEDRLFENPDDRLYHPVKSNIENLNNEVKSDKIKYNFFQKLFSFRNRYENSVKIKTIYLLFFKISFKCK